MKGTNTIAPRSGTAFELRKGEQLKVIDPCGEQVSDLICFSRENPKEYLSSGRTFDYNETLLLTKGHKLYSDRSQIMLKIIEDEVGRHDFLLTPCSKETFKIIYGHKNPHQGCFGNLQKALAKFDISPEQIPTTFNIFMRVDFEQDGKISVMPPISKAGESIIFQAEMDLIVGLTACSAEQSNNGSFKPIEYAILERQSI